MQVPIPNSAGFADIDEANTSTSMGYAMHFGKRKGRKKRVREFNACHDASTGKFCSERTASMRFKGMLRRAQDPGRAKRVMRSLDKAMRAVRGNVSRAVTLRKRMDVAGPLAYRNAQNSLVGTFKRIILRNEPYRGKKR